jgi:KDO2-lipid IV(A) lauroyltransferase
MNKQARQVWEERAATAVSRIASRLPRSAALALGRGLGRVLSDLDRRHAAIAVENLRRAFPEWDEARRWRTARGVYAHFGEMLIELLRLPSLSRAQMLGLVEIAGREHVERAIAAGRGVLYVTGHYGNWEIHAIAHGFLFAPVSVVARPLDNPALDQRLCAVRSLSGNAVIYKQRALLQVLKALRSGGGVAILIDQNVQEGDGIFVDFFGRPAATTTVAAAVALKTGCAVVPVRAERRPDGGHRLVYEPPVSVPTTGEKGRDIARLTQALTARIEGWIRETPEQWLWMHRRWKTQPKLTNNHRGTEGTETQGGIGRGVNE